MKRQSPKLTIVPYPAGPCVVAVWERAGLVETVSFEADEATARQRAAKILGADEFPENPKLANRLRKYFAGNFDDFGDVAVRLPEPGFGRDVLLACRAIPYGETRTYQDLAKECGSPKAARAVGRVMATNTCPILVGCHRVLRSDGTLGGYSGFGGLQTKQWLLDLEAKNAERGSDQAPNGLFAATVPVRSAGSVVAIANRPT